MTLSEYLNMLFPFFGDRKGFGATPKTKKGRGKARGKGRYGLLYDVYDEE